MINTDTKFFWVVGCPRSGTTYLTDLIGRNCDLTYNEPGHDPDFARGRVATWQFPPADTICFKWCENYKVADEILSRFPNSYFIHIARERNNNVYSMAFPKEDAFPPRDFPKLGSEADVRITNAMGKWVEYNQGCVALQDRLGHRYVPIFYEHLPGRLDYLENAIGLPLRDRPAFRNKNLPKTTVGHLDKFWSEIKGTGPLLNKLGRLRELQASDTDTTGSATRAKITKPVSVNPEPAGADTSNPGAYRAPHTPLQTEPKEKHLPDEGMTFPSPYGGLWTDGSAAPDIIQGKLQLGWISEDEAEQLLHAHQYGFLVIPNALPESQLDAVSQVFEQAWQGDLKGCEVSFWKDGEKQQRPAELEFVHETEAKLLDLHMASPVVREAVVSKKIRRYLDLLFERPPMAFQSLGFWYGSEQPLHSDVAYVRVDSPREFCASWIALEDVARGSGELMYYPGSHMLPDFLLNNGSVWSTSVMSGYASALAAGAEAAGLSKEFFTPNRGDALIWTAGLYHGGAPRELAESTRKSLVTHYCPLGRQPPYLAQRNNPVLGTPETGLACGAFISELAS